MVGKAKEKLDETSKASTKVSLRQEAAADNRRNENARLVKVQDGSVLDMNVSKETEARSRAKKADAKAIAVRKEEILGQATAFVESIIGSLLLDGAEEAKRDRAYISNRRLDKVRGVLEENGANSEIKEKGCRNAVCYARVTAMLVYAV